MGENHFEKLPTALYGFVLLMSGVAFLLLQVAIVADRDNGALLAGAIGRDRKGKASLLLYAVAIGLSFVQPWLAEAIYLLVAAMWLIPDRRIERALKGRGGIKSTKSANTKHQRKFKLQEDVRFPPKSK